MVQAQSDNVMSLAEENINGLLNQRHRIREGSDSDFSVRNLTALANSAAETTRTMSLLLGAIASVSLLVGGIGIMNIMLVSVTERTREIGIRMAIGARQRDILMQFLLEAIGISIVGCLSGIVMGVGGAFAVNMFTGTEIIIATHTVAIAFGVAASIGIFFGFYPARKAAKLNPIEALRYQ
jgi:putative ABC transport system permease protein